MKNKKTTNKMIFFRLLRKVSQVSPLQFWSIYLCFILNGIVYGVSIKVKQLVFDGAVSFASGNKTMQYMFMLLLIFLLVEVLSILLNYGGNFIAENYDIKSTSLLKQEVHYKINKLPNIYFEDNKMLDSIDKSYEGINTAVQFINSFMDMLFMYTPAIVAVGIYLFNVNRTLMLIMLFIFVPVVYAQFIKAKIHGKLEDDVAPLRRKCRYYIDASVGRKSFKETRILGAFSYLRMMFTDTLDIMQRLRLKVEVKNNIYELSARLMSLAGYLGVLFVLFHLLMQGKITVGMFTAIFSSIDDMYSLMEEAIVTRMGNYAMDYGKIKNYFNLMNFDEEHKNNSNKASGNLIFENVTFSYPYTKSKALDNVSFTLNAGEVLAVVGQNGSGKTTLSKLLTGLYKPSEGSIKWNGHDTEEVSFEDISQVFQNFQRYKMTLYQNVSISDIRKEDDSNEKILNALKDSGVLLDNKTYPKGLKTMLSKEFGGVDLSGGQWQKIAISRAFYRDSSIIILDEPTSAIDPIEEDAVYKRFQKLIKGKTAVIITHRLGAVRFADKIVVMNKGKITDFGTHNYLLKNNEEYREMWTSQSQHYLDE